MDRFLHAKSHLRPASLDNYEVMIGVWERDHTPPGCRLRSVQPKHLKTYIHASDVEQATRCTRYRHLRAFLNWTVEEGYLDRSPLEDVRQPKKEKKQPAFFSADDIEKIMLAIDAHAELQAGERGPTPDDQWLKDLIRVAVATGLRRSELLNLRFEDIDFQHGILHVRNRDRERTKSGHERSVKLVGGALQVLRRRYAEWEEGGRVFVDVNGTPIKPDRATKRFKFFVRKAKLPNRERLNFHSLRHTAGSWLAMKGVPMAVIRDIIGHSSTQITEIYSHATSAAAARAMEETFGEF